MAWFGGSMLREKIVRIVSGLAASAALTGLLVFGGVASAAPGDFELESPQFQLGYSQCTSGAVFNTGVNFVTRTPSQATADADVDVNVGSTVSSDLWIDAPGSEVYGGVVANFLVAGAAHEVDEGDVTRNSGWSLLAEAPHYVVTSADAGTVLEFSATRIRISQYNLDCSPSPGDGVVGVYVNKEPVTVDDVASTDNATAVVVDVLVNDDASWDSGVITSNYPTVAELAGQDDLSEVPAAERGTAVAIAAGPTDGAAVVESDGQITYTPDTDFTGTDTFTYSLTDNDGATSMATVTVDVADPVVATLVMTPSTTTVDQGESVTLTVAGFNAGGIELGDVTDEVVFTSDVATDVVTGNEVSFPTASPHTITATHTPTGVTQSVVIEVVPPAVVTAPDEDMTTPAATPARLLPDVGGPSVGWLAGGVLALLAGAGLLARRRTT